MKKAIHFNQGYGGKVFLGKTYGNNLRLQTDVGFLTKELGKGAIGESEGRINLVTTTANVFWDYNNTSPITPFIGVGVGIATPINVDFKYSNPAIDMKLEAHDRAIAILQLQAGASYQVNPSLRFVADYAYLRSSQFHLKGEARNKLGSIVSCCYTKSRLSEHLFSAGIRYDF
ncbi:outer membrane protein [Polycladidibacter stylochi]|uniref:outer membrane protein n=1 Tax=Polycladidibacter stylochi TaxID=1807766 RepID=UPI000833E228|nr:outer membrane beta-barrel protein [Pseudovibrio stylochi]